MKNHSLETDTPQIDYTTYQMGGKRGGNIASKPNGGFPPIVLCESKEADEFNDDDKKTRYFTSHKNAVSIKQIMEKRKEITPFISLSGMEEFKNNINKSKKNKK